VIRIAAAIEVRWPQRPGEDDIGRLLALVDAFRPSALEEQDHGVRLFFGAAADRDAALTALERSATGASMRPVDVPDDRWAERSQADLAPVRVGDLVVAPPWAAGDQALEWLRAPGPHSPASGPAHLIVIQPSMGFGTGHHASTRLCLALLQRVRLSKAAVLDVGTGSGVLAIAAWTLGAGRIVGLDVDPDALQSARENLDLNRASGAIDLRLQDALSISPGFRSDFDVVTANLTGAAIEQHGDALAAFLRPGGHLIASGFQPDEEAAVAAALDAAGLNLTDRLVEEEWVGLTCNL
jgi:ribosomal protein L11 methyltransferase